MIYYQGGEVRDHKINVVACNLCDFKVSTVDLRTIGVEAMKNHYKNDHDEAFAYWESMHIQEIWI